MKKNSFFILSVFLIFSVAFFSCSNSSSESESASVKIVLPSMNSRQAQEIVSLDSSSNDDENVYFELVLSSSDSEKEYKKDGLEGETILFEDIQPGIYTLFGKAIYQGEEFGEGTEELTVLEGENNASLTIIVPEQKREFSLSEYKVSFDSEEVFPLVGELPEISSFYAVLNTTDEENSSEIKVKLTSRLYKLEFDDSEVKNAVGLVPVKVSSKKNEENSIVVPVKFYYIPEDFEVFFSNGSSTEEALNLVQYFNSFANTNNSVLDNINSIASRFGTQTLDYPVSLVGECNKEKDYVQFMYNEDENSFVKDDEGNYITESFSDVSFGSAWALKVNSTGGGESWKLN